MLLVLAGRKNKLIHIIKPMIVSFSGNLVAFMRLRNSISSSSGNLHEKDEYMSFSDCSYY
jgi:hypothetical protein